MYRLARPRRPQECSGFGLHRLPERPTPETAIHRVIRSPEGSQTSSQIPSSMSTPKLKRLCRTARPAIAGSSRRAERDESPERCQSRPSSRPSRTRPSSPAPEIKTSNPGASPAATTSEYSSSDCDESSDESWSGVLAKLGRQAREPTKVPGPERSKPSKDGRFVKNDMG